LLFVGLGFGAASAGAWRPKTASPLRASAAPAAAERETDMGLLGTAVGLGGGTSLARATDRWSVKFDTKAPLSWKRTAAGEVIDKKSAVSRAALTPRYWVDRGCGAVAVHAVG
jgi:hypothetical protein